MKVLEFTLLCQDGFARVSQGALLQEPVCRQPHGAEPGPVLLSDDRQSVHHRQGPVLQLPVVDRGGGNQSPVTARVGGIRSWP